MLKTLYPLVKNKGQQPTYILIMPRLFKEGLMLCQTEKGKQIRSYYLDMMEVMEIYLQYQNTVVMNQQTCEISDLKQMLLEDRKKAEEDRKKAEEDRKKAEEDRKKAEEDRKKAEEKEKKAEERFQRLIGVSEDTKETLQDTKREVLKTNHKLDQVIKDRVVMKNVSSKKKELLYIYRLKTAYDSEPDYYSFRCQTGNIEALVSAREQRLSERRVKRWNKKKKLTNTDIKRLVMKLPREEIPKLIKIKEIGYTSYLPNAVIFWDKYMEEKISSGVITNSKNGAFDIQWEEADFLIDLETEDRLRGCT
jgi:hypothetical protein